MIAADKVKRMLSDELRPQQLSVNLALKFSELSPADGQADGQADEQADERRPYSDNLLWLIISMVR